jgi:hypothetical protein
MSLTPKHVVEWVAAAALIISLLAWILVKKLISDTVNDRQGLIIERVSVIARRDQDVLAYLVSYIIPLTTVSVASWSGVIGFLLIIVLVLYLSLETQVRYVNPPIFLMGFRFYSVRLGQSEFLLLTKETRAELSNNKNKQFFRIAGHDILIGGEDAE